MAPFVVLLDACVLYPAALRDLLLSLAQTSLFRARWSDAIHEEWMRGVLRSRPELAEALQRTRALMDEAVPDCLVRGFESHVDALSLPDPADRHVLAAAIVGRASVIVTYNMKDFPEGQLAPYGIHAEHPDQFISNMFDLNPPAVAAQVKRLRGRLHKPPLSVEELLDRYLAAGLPETVADLRSMAELL